MRITTRRPFRCLLDAEIIHHTVELLLHRTVAARFVRLVSIKYKYILLIFFQTVSIQTIGVVKFKRTCPVQVSHFDHLVLTVKSVPDTINFYTSVLGMEVTTFKVCQLLLLLLFIVVRRGSLLLIITNTLQAFIIYNNNL